jgi:hypothetical protein
MRGLFIKAICCYSVLLIVAITGTCVAADITAAIGDKVELKGTALVTDSVYLFVTGPGLAQDGVNPGNMRVPVVTGVPGTFTMVDVVNDRWTYTWNTARQGFSLKEGLYTVYAVKQPVSKADLKAQSYGSTTVALTYGGGPLVTDGTILVSTSPVQAEIYLNNQIMGLTPLELRVPTGTYMIQLVSGGYKPVSEQVSVQAGSYTEINRVLVPIEGPKNTVDTALPMTTELPFTVSNSAHPPATKAPLGLAAITGPVLAGGLIIIRMRD